MKKYYEENSNNDPLEPLLSILKSAPQPKFRIIDPKRYDLMLDSATKLQAMLSETYSDGEMVIDVGDTFNLGSISVELEDFQIDNPAKFTEIISNASSFEIYPLVNGKIRLEITFQRILKSIY